MCIVSHSSNSTCVAELRSPGRFPIRNGTFQRGLCSQGRLELFVLVSFTGERQCVAMDGDMDELVAHSPGPDGPPQLGSSELASDAGKHPHPHPTAGRVSVKE